MKRSRLIGTTTVAVAAFVASALYMSNPAKSSDHQDTFNLGTSVGHNTTADITDVYVFPSPSNPNNVVLAMDTAPLTPAGMGTSIQFDPTLLWQFKISHAASGKEDQVIQFTASGTGASQILKVYGPATPNEVGTSNTLVAQTGAVTYNTATALTINGTPGASFFAGPRADPFNFDLFAFFSFFGDRDFQAHTAQSDTSPGLPTYNADNTGVAGMYSAAYDKTANRATMPTFNGFTAGTMSNSSLTGGASSPLGNYACSTGAASNTLLALGGFNVESFVIEVPKSLLMPSGTSSTIHVWATVSSSTTTS